MRALFLSKGKNDTIVTSIATGKYDGQGIYQQSNPGVRIKFNGGKFDTDDIDIAKKLITSHAMASEQIALVGICPDSGFNFGTIDESKTKILADIKTTVGRNDAVDPKLIDKLFDFSAANKKG